MRVFEAVVIGAGSGGLTAARRLALAGRRTALIEADRLGGDCLNWGCVPTKTLIETARLRWQASRADAYGLRVADVELDFSTLMAHVATVQADVGAEERRYYLEEPGVEVIFGAAAFRDAHTLTVGDEEVRFRFGIIATGSRPRTPAIPGLDEAGALTNISILQLDHFPASLLVLGGGPIGCEYAQLFQRLGSQVTLVQRGDRLLPRDEPGASAVVARAFAAEGVTVHLNAATKHVERQGEMRVVHVAAQGRAFAVAAEAVLVAVGRQPNVEALDLAAAGVATGDRGISTDERMRTNQAHLYAIGDVAGKGLFTHVAAEQGWVAAGAILGKHGRFSERAVPWCTFTDPEVAHVGLTEAQARARHGDRVRVLTWPFRRVDRALTLGRTEGFISLVVAPGWLRSLGGGEVVGAQVVGPEAGELIGELALLVRNHLPLGLLARTIHAYPTLSLGVLQAAAQPWQAPAAIRAWR